MKVIYLLIIYFMNYSLAFSQTYSGKLFDKQSEKPIPYANIGIANKNIGTVSNADGVFNLELNSIENNDSLFISCIGYERKSYLVSNFKGFFRSKDQIIIELQPKIYEMSEVVVRPMGTKLYTLGNFCEPDSPYGNAFYSKKLGTEMSVKIELPEDKEIAHLQNFRFGVGKFTFDKFRVRLNVYNLANGVPAENILTEQIFVDITSDGTYVIDLKKYKIITHGDFFISLEYFTVPDREEGELIFCSVQQEDERNGYYRLTSYGSWTHEIVANIGFSVQIRCEE